jgi:aspartyl-tRNA(Asn)/glutamyl-tRNA(Gln) amidotransferase subunit C
MAKKVLSREEILHLARLAKLTLTDEEIGKYQKQFSETIDYIKNLEELNTQNVKPTNSVVDLKNVTYEDGAKSIHSLTTKEAVQNASQVKDNEFVVDRIME